ncbi:winged helix-turn-helix domain-containing protein [Halococcus salifodinae]|uniref:winged helix-turn-helix domain-containing protein n=1 Tax=Halococcus salifodinae TaxID=36738 RepID=UPI001F4CDEB8|nr:winged helix-turn-helix domain-containing protein [Halococcus salifodinae]
MAENFRVEYPLAHIYHVMHKIGLSIQTAQSIAYQADSGEQRHWHNQFKKSGRR